MWILRKGDIIRVDFYVDPCWTKADIWSMRNLYARFTSLGKDAATASSLAAATLWKRKWPGSQYSAAVEKTLLRIKA
jgi:hypothetical protein